MPIFIARRNGSSPLSSRFVAVHEPYGGEGFIETVSLVPLGAHPDAVVLEIRHKGMTDHVVIQTAKEGRKLTVGELVAQCEVAFVRERDGDPIAMGLWGGDELRWGNRVLAGSGTYEGAVKGVLREDDGDPYNALVITGDLPVGDTLSGGTVVATFGDGSTMGYRVSSVKRHDGETHLVLIDDPGIAVDPSGMRHIFFPLREIPGGVTYRLRSSAFVAFGDAGARVESVASASISEDP